MAHPNARPSPARSAWGGPSETAEVAKQAWSSQNSPGEFTADDDELPMSPTPMPQGGSAVTLSAPLPETPLPSPSSFAGSPGGSSIATSAASPTSPRDYNQGGQGRKASNQSMSGALQEDKSQYKSLNMWSGIQEMVQGMKMGTRRRRLSWFKVCVSGRELNDAVLKYLRSSGDAKFAKADRKQSLKICQRLCDHDKLICLNPKEEDVVADSKTRFYRVVKAGTGL